MSRQFEVVGKEATAMEGGNDRLDEAARAAWLHFVAGNTQQKVADSLGISRQSAQRLISLAVEAKLVRIEVIHPIARCMALAERLKVELGLRGCTVVPTDPAAPSATFGLAQEAAAQIERQLRAEAPIILSVGTGRTLSAAAAMVSPMSCPQHRIVACVGSTSIEGWATFHEVVMRLANTVRARHYPMPVPVMANSPEERRVLLDQKPVRKVIELVRAADVVFIGIGHLQDGATLFEDGFVTNEELLALRQAGAVGEIVGWSFDAAGNFIEGLTNDRVASIPPERGTAARVVGVAMGETKTAAILGAIRGRLINSLITDERTADALITLAAAP
jgi:DNA-binding transcriptional regulator LsrR (DeoR family)